MMIIKRIIISIFSLIIFTSCAAQNVQQNEEILSDTEKSHTQEYTEESSIDVFDSKYNNERETDWSDDDTVEIESHEDGKDKWSY